MSGDVFYRSVGRTIRGETPPRILSKDLMGCALAFRQGRGRDRETDRAVTLAFGGDVAVYCFQDLGMQMRHEGALDFIEFGDSGDGDAHNFFLFFFCLFVYIFT